MREFKAAELTRIRTAFNHPDFVFELKHDGFRALAYVEPNGCRLVSKSGHVYRAFGKLCSQLGRLGRDAVLDGEIVILDDSGRSMFYDLMRRRGNPVFYAFDCLALDGQDLRGLSLVERKQRLTPLIENSSSILNAQCIEGLGEPFFELICKRDLEGIVAKRRDAPYGQDWFKIRNPKYTQYEGRRELFDRKR